MSDFAKSNNVFERDSRLSRGDAAIPIESKGLASQRDADTALPLAGLTAYTQTDNQKMIGILVENGFAVATHTDPTTILWKLTFAGNIAKGT